MRVLVTGGAGFIGSHIVDALIANGDTVDVIDNLSTGFKRNVNKEAGFYQLCFDDPETEDILKNGYDIIIHQAAQIDLRKSIEDPSVDLQNDVVATVKLIKRAVENNVKHFLFASSGGAIYGEQDYFPADENHKINPSSPYGLNKWIIERYLNYFCEQYGLKYTALRYANVYGPRQNHLSEAGVVSIFANYLLEDRECIINGSGEQTRDFVFVSDVVEANLAAIQKGYHGEINIGTGEEVSVNQVFNTIKDLTGSDQIEKHGPEKKGEQFRSVLSFEKAKKELNWQPVISFNEGIKRTVQYFKNMSK
ncbi:NAD-dependent epimerase/dehydratase family protein [candidate division KSB1 bacterium]